MHASEVDDVVLAAAVLRRGADPNAARNSDKVTIPTPYTLAMWQCRLNYFGKTFQIWCDICFFLYGGWAYLNAQCPLCPELPEPIGIM